MPRTQLPLAFKPDVSHYKNYFRRVGGRGSQGWHIVSMSVICCLFCAEFDIAVGIYFPGNVLVNAADLSQGC